MNGSDKRVLPIAVALLGGAAVVAWLWPASAPAPSDNAATAAGAATPAAGAGHRTRSAVEAPSLGDPAAADDPYADSPIGDVMHKVVDNDPQLRTFKSFYDRPLLDAESLKQYHALLSDPATLAAVEHDLLYPEEAKADQASSIKRLMKIDYLHEALDWKENPQHALVVSVVTETVLTDNYPPDMAMDMRVSLSGNKRELFQLLDEYEPDQAKLALAAAKGTRLEAMVAWIARSNDTRKQLESQLDNQVTP